MAHAGRNLRHNVADVFIEFGLVMAFVCSAFAAAASSVVAYLYFTGAFGDSAGFGLRIGIKAIGFGGIAVGSLWILSRRKNFYSVREEATGEHPANFWWGFLPAASLAALLLFTNLDRHPWPAPDELHHLIVARNLAEYGAYASGLAPNLVWFDHYDSVGAPVIGLVAGAFKLFGAGIEPARLVLAVFGVAFTTLVYFLFLPIYGTRASAFASFLSLASFGTIYLARSLYGEVPALAFVLLGLLAWRRGLSGGRNPLLVAAGVCFGLAVLTKAFMLVTALAVIGVYVFDRASHRRITPLGMVLPAAGTFLTLGVWQAVEFAGRHLVTDDKPSLALYYRHSLTFGFEPVWDNVGLIALAIPALVLAAIALGLAVPRVFRDQYDPALAVLLFLAPLLLFWFAFFTPMHLPRYLWYPAVVAAMFSGPLGSKLMAARNDRVVTRRFFVPARVLAAGLLAWVYLVPSAGIVYRVFAADHAGPDQAVARYIAELPATTRIATTYWPAERLLNFLDERPVTVLTNATATEADYDVLIDSDLADVKLAARQELGRRFGHYIVYRRNEAHVAILGANP